MRSLRSLVPFAILLGITLSGPSPAASAPPVVVAPPAAADPLASPPRVWVAWLDGRSLEDALATGASVLDRFPDAVIVADDASRAALGAASFRLEPAVSLPAGATVTLLRGGPRATPLEPGVLASQGITVLWRGGDDAIVASASPPDGTAALVRWHLQALRTRPLTRAAAEKPAAPKSVVAPPPRTDATDFAPVIQDMVDQVSGPALIDDIGHLAGRGSVLVGGTPVTFTTRSTPTTKCDQAEQYVFERFQAMGFTDVAYDPYTFSSTSARNVVATLPGVETPGRVIILGGHLDSTSPQASTNAPGANDNASGVAGLFATAQILKQYTFKKTIKFIAFTGEEQGLYGSTHYANAAAARGDSIDGVVIYDMIGWHNALNQIDIEGETPWLSIMNVMDDAVHRYTGLATQIQLVSFGSDHVPFQDVNIPAFLAIETEYDNYPCYHQTCDTTGWNQPVFTADVVKAGLATVAHLAGTRGFFISHTPLPSTENTQGPYDVVATISQLAALVADSLQLHYSLGGAYNTVNLTPTGSPNQYHAGIPGIPAGTIHYWLSAADVEDRSAVSPEGAPDSTFAFTVAPRETLLAEGFESGAAGWTTGGAANDWQFATPAGLTEDPASAHSGTKVAGNDVTGLGANPGRYENNANNYLESPAIDCTGATDVRLTFWRDLAVERSNGGTWDYGRVLVNGTVIYESPSGTPNLNDAGWQFQSYDIHALADGNPSVKIRFALKSDASVVFGGWNLDDVMVTGYAPPPLAVGDPIAPRAAVLLASAPNPGRFGTMVRFDLPRRERVQVGVYDVRGRLVRTLADGVREGGHHEIAWDGRASGGAPSGSGVYFTRLTVAGAIQSRKFVLLR